MFPSTLSMQCHPNIHINTLSHTLFPSHTHTHEMSKNCFLETWNVKNCWKLSLNHYLPFWMVKDIQDNIMKTMEDHIIHIVFIVYIIIGIRLMLYGWVAILVGNFSVFNICSFTQLITHSIRSTFSIQLSDWKN